MGLLWRAVAAVGAVLLGGVTAVLAVAVHDRWWGLALGVAASVAVAAALPAGWWRRLPFTAGWSLAVGWLAVPRADGGYVIAADLPGYVLLAVAVALPLVGLLTLPGGRRVRGREPGHS